MTPSRHRARVRKIVYTLVILGLLFPLWWLGHPATRGTQGQPGSPGGKLAQLRRENQFDQAELGQLDPTSQTIKLATLGMRGIAADLLWTKVNEYHKKKDWTNLSATLTQLTKIEPNFVEVWRHQGWNLAYNCSVEFDDYRERYRWVIKGINFLKLGISYNEYEPKLYQALGWTISQKIGRSDEHVLFRKLFTQDDEYHGTRPRDERDNWLVGKLWYRDAEKVCDTRDIPLGGASPLIFRSQAPMCQMNYGMALAEDGVFGEKAKRAWQQAAKEWADYGKFPIPTSEGILIHLGEMALCEQNVKRLQDKLDALVPGERQRLAEHKAGSLTEEHKKALEVPEDRRTVEQYQLAEQAKELLRVTDDEVARQATANRREANAMLEQIKKADEVLRFTRSYRQVVNYDYWERRAVVEQTQEMRDAREHVHEARVALDNGNLPLAIRGFHQGSVKWAEVLRRFPELVPDRATSDDIDDLVNPYAKALDQQDALFPPDFPLAWFVNYRVSENPHQYELQGAMKKLDKALQEGDLSVARRECLAAIQSWDQVLVDLPSLRLMCDPRTGQTILACLATYAEILKRLDKPIPDDTPLARFTWIQLDHDPATQAARQATAEAGTLAASDPAGAKKSYERGFALWRETLNKYPTAVVDRTVGAEVLLAVDGYRQVLAKLNEPLPKPFVLQDILDRQTAPKSPKPQDAVAPPE